MRSTCILRFSRSEFFWLSRCPSHPMAHIKYPSSLCVCTCVYKHTPSQHPNTRQNRGIYKTNPQSLPLLKHSIPRRQQAILTMNTLERNHIQFSPTHACRFSKNTCDTHACSSKWNGLTMNKLKKNHFQSPPTHACMCSKNTCDTHATSRGIGQFK